MTLQPLAVHVQLRELHYLGGGEGTAEPYLWIVFFKVDGHTAFVNEVQNLRGTATVALPIETRDLPEGVRPGDSVAIPDRLGSYRTVLRPIPLRIPIAPVESVGGLIGFLAVLWEEDNTPLDARAQAPEILRNAIQRELDALVPTLGMAHKAPTPEEIDALSDRIKNEVETRLKIEIIDQVATNVLINPLALLTGATDLDDQCGQMLETFSSEKLLRDGPVIPIRSGREVIDVKDTFDRVIGKVEVSVLRGDGEWEIDGQITAIPFSLRSFFAVTGLNAAAGVRGLLASIPLDPFAVRPTARSVRLVFEKFI